ncbi:MAG: polymer-forming cytoskeletal protein [Vulcanimicrobiota bacterium]
MGGEAFSENLELEFPDQTIEDGAADIIPDIDVADYVAGGMSSPPLAGGSPLSGYVYVRDARSRSGSLTVSGTLSLTEGTLYVDGDLTVYGNIEGTGSIYTTGDITMLGGSATVISDRTAGVALLAGGDISLEGINAAGALQNLANVHGFQSAVERLVLALENYEQNPAGGHQALGKHDGPWVPDPPDPEPSPDPFRPLQPKPIVEWINPIAGPNGGHGFALSNAAPARVALSLKETYPGYASDPLASKVLKAMEDLQYFFRSNKHYIKHDGTSYVSQDGTRAMILAEDYQLSDAGVPIPTHHFSPNVLDWEPPLPQLLLLVVDDESTGLTENWDDQELPDHLRTHDAINALSLGTSLHGRRRDAFFQANNPLDANWLGDSYFQGMVYARGDVTVKTNFQIVGALISLGSISLYNGCWLTYNEEYTDLVGEHLPVGVAFYEEL